MAHVEVDQDTCISDQVCAATAPDVFEMGADGKAYVVDGMEEVEGADLEMAREAAAACPVDAISIDE
ncbi:Ferredoxin [Halanaeroarchaeum sp. HSR-CO]|uniref:ferredoxin n=1 Tax=Halanaeroarchaeum sp. HSR-CO TaxID=2866382 RepID=UPI00217D0FD7|nr:ferredoxin [Halanaeroarchaeum sp. HSR-CO]UWG46825.1 Ferredoxin [Halanaeroarchaeum sp. HSR-CO]